MSLPDVRVTPNSLHVADAPGSRQDFGPSATEPASSFPGTNGMSGELPSYKAVFVSPHLDDAVFSCAGEIAHLCEQGPVLVLNLFTKYPEEVKLGAVVIGSERYEEERAAARFLSYTSHNFDELDAFFRRPAYRSIGNIFRPPVAEDSETYLPGLRKRVFDFLDALNYERLYVPMAIGWHVDHMLAHLVFEPWADRPNLFYYEDAPYSLLPQATKYRLKELSDFSGDPRDQSLAPESRLVEWWQTTVAYARSALIGNLRPKFIRPFARVVVGWYLFRLMSLHRQAPALARRGSALESRLLLDKDAFERKVRAITLYRSQFREFFRDVDDCISTYQAYSRLIDGDPPSLERYWKLVNQD
jgi:LmbE family N-acetylglucosaminyl deacetylase